MPRHENGVANCHAVSDSVSDAISALICHEAPAWSPVNIPFPSAVRFKRLAEYRFDNFNNAPDLLVGQAGIHG